MCWSSFKEVYTCCAVVHEVQQKSTTADCCSTHRLKLKNNESPQHLMEQIKNPPFASSKLVI